MKKIFNATILSFIVYKILDWLIHGVILFNGYEELGWLYRSDMNDYMWVFFVGPFVVLLLLAQLYTTIKKQYQPAFIGIIPLIIMIPAAFYSWASFDIPETFVLMWFGTGILQVMITLKVMTCVLEDK
jgi:hypothetical protein